MKKIIIWIILLAVFVSAILIDKALNIWEYTTIQRTMFQYGRGQCELTGKIIKCGNFTNEQK